MPPKLLIDLDSINLDNIEDDIEGIRRHNSQRFEMEQLSGIIYYNEQDKIVVGYKDVTEDEFWVRGHIPGRPLMPGVIMCEAAAQLSSYYFMRSSGDNRFLGFGGLENVKFRGQVSPGRRLILIAHNTDMRTRRAVFNTQGVVDGKMVFEAVIIGMPV